MAVVLIFDSEELRYNVFDKSNGAGSECSFGECVALKLVVVDTTGAEEK